MKALFGFILNLMLISGFQIISPISTSSPLLSSRMAIFGKKSADSNAGESSAQKTADDFIKKSKLNSKLSASSSSSTSSSSLCKILVAGVGGGGSNAVNRMMDSLQAVPGLEYCVINTDMQALSRSPVPKKLNIGVQVSRGLGAGGNPDVGARAATESREDILQLVKDKDLVFVTAGMGGGTGSGAAPVVAECAKEQGALTVGVVTKPFGFEGKRRMQQANDAIANLKDEVDTLIVVANDKLLALVPDNTPLNEAFLVADDVLRQGVVGISEIIVRPGLVNVDFADVRTIMSNAGTALMGIGKAKGKNRAEEAAHSAISSPLLESPVTQARGIIFNVVGGPDLTLTEINHAAKVIQDSVDSNANIIFGALIDEKITNGEVTITVLATGFATDGCEGAGAIGSRKEVPPFRVTSSSRISRPMMTTMSQLQGGGKQTLTTSLSSPASSLSTAQQRYSIATAVTPTKEVKGNQPIRQRLPLSATVSSNTVTEKLGVRSSSESTQLERQKGHSGVAGFFRKIFGLFRR